MKKVTLWSLTLRNFRGEKDRTTAFKADETSIVGGNGLGKTRHFDAFVWLLFGKDSQDRKDYNIKTLVDGRPLERVDTEVSAVLEVAGERIALRRVYAEKWIKPRGEVEERFAGHEHRLFWNDVPLKVGEYQNRVNAIVEESVFKMITNPLFFAGMRWQDQREQLFQLAGAVRDADIAAQKPEYAALLDRIRGKSLADFKREIAARKKKLKVELESVQPRIDQTHKLMPEELDFAALEEELKALEEQVAEVDGALLDATKALRMQQEAAQAQQRTIHALRQKQQNVLHAAKMEATKAALLANESRHRKESLIKVLSIQIGAGQRLLKGLQDDAAALERRIAEKETEIVGARQEWHAEYAAEYCGDGACSVCRQPLPKEQQEQAQASFEQRKQEKLTKIKQRGGSLRTEIDGLKGRLASVTTDIGRVETSIGVGQGDLDRLQEELSALPVVAASEVRADDLPEYAALAIEINALEGAMESAMENNAEKVDTRALQDRKQAIMAKLDSVKAALQTRELIEKYRSEIRDLEAKGRQLAQQIADVEREEYVMQGFTKAKVEECERRINGLFTRVTFRLFEYTIDGNESETCVPLVDGVPFGAANTAGQLNAGLDIINALVRYHGVSAPIFIDGRESVNRIIPCASQIINLVVSPDKQLTVV